MSSWHFYTLLKEKFRVHGVCCTRFPQITQFSEKL